MPDEPCAAGDKVSALQAANAPLRAVVEAKDTEIPALRVALEGERAARAGQDELIRRLKLRVAGLERRAGMDSGNCAR